MYPNGHNRTIEKLQPSGRYPDAQQIKRLWPRSDQRLSRRPPL